MTLPAVVNLNYRLTLLPAVGCGQAVKFSYSRAESRVSESLSPKTSISAIQPSPYGSELIVSGLESNLSLIATTFPDIGA